MTFEKHNRVNMQDQVLNQVRKGNHKVTVDTIGGKSYQGVLNSFDSHCLVLVDENDDILLLFKNNVICVLPDDPDKKIEILQNRPERDRD